MANEKFSDWTVEKLARIPWGEFDSVSKQPDSAGVFLIRSGDARIYAGGTSNLRERLSVIESNPRWSESFELDAVFVSANDEDFSGNDALKSIVSQNEQPILNIC